MTPPATQRSWLAVERLPSYAPDLNPVEGLWGNLKGTELADLCVDTIAETEYNARRGVRRIRKRWTRRSRSCDAPVFPYDETVTALYESQ